MNRSPGGLSSFQRNVRILPGSAPRRHPANEQARKESDEQREARHTQVQGRRDQQIHVAGLERDQEPVAEVSEQQSDDAAQQRQQQCFQHDQAQDSSPSCPQGKADGDFLLPTVGSRQQEIGDVSTGNEQNQRRHAECEQPRFAKRGMGAEGAPRSQRCRAEFCPKTGAEEAFVLVAGNHAAAIMGGHAGRQHIQSDACLGRAHSGPQSADQVKAHRSRSFEMFLHHRRNPELWRGLIQSLKTGRSHSNHGADERHGKRRTHSDRLSENSRIAIEPTLPGGVA